MQQNRIACPQCGTEIELSQTLAQPIIAEAKKQAEEQVKAAQARVVEAEAEARSAQDEAARAKRQAAEQMAAVAAEVNQRIANERLAIQEEERTRLRAELAPELLAERRRTKAAEERASKAEAAELGLRERENELKIKEDTIELRVARLLQERSGALQEEADRRADERSKLTIAEKDKTISDMAAKLEEAQRKATQGSQQLQGEILELDLESELRHAFPTDDVLPVKPGRSGGDILQRVCAGAGRASGTIFWESKRAHAWSNDWVAKAKQDARECGAEAVVMVSSVVPKGMKSICLLDGVLVCPQELALVIAAILRRSLLEVAAARRVVEGRSTKAELVYGYLTGAQFKSWVEGIAEPFVQMQRDLDSEMNYLKARWKRRQKQIERVQDSVAGIYGDLQALAGSEMPTLPEFEVELTQEEGAA